MANELQQDQPQVVDPTNLTTPLMKRFLLILNLIILIIGNLGGPQLMRLYFIHGGNRIWLSSLFQTAAFPLLLIPLTLLHFHRHHAQPETSKFFTMKLPLLSGSAFIGFILGLDNYLYAFGVSRLPVSTFSLIMASQLAFTALFAFLLVKQKFTSYSINSIFLLVIGSAMLGLNASSDRPVGVTKHEYYVGFFMIVAAAALYGFQLPAVEMIYKKGRQVVTYGLVLEFQLVMCFFASLFSTVGMIVSKDFQAIPREAREYGLGEANYIVVIIMNAIVWQCYFLGAIGVIFCSSSLFSGVLITLLLPFTEVLAVIIYKEKFQGEKGVALVMSLWGFASYFYGEMKLAKKLKNKAPHSPTQGVNDKELTSINV